jgi:predicted phosphodiesterase
VHVIYGNNDGERAGLRRVLPQIDDGPRRVTLPAAGGGRTVVMAHFLDWLEPADLAGADIVITGHDHRARIERREAGPREVLFLNPGECCGWVTGRCTAALLEVDAQGARAELVELHG